MTLHATLFCIRIVPYSAKPETHVVTLPVPDLDDADATWDFAKNALAEFLPRTIELEEKLALWDDADGESGFFFSGSDPASDDHYHILLKYTLF